MNKTTKIYSLLILLISFVSCDLSSEDGINLNGELKANYTFVKETEAGTVTFINTSNNADSFEWDFGDGTSSTTISPTKVYTETGEYLVKLTAKNNLTGQSNSFSSTVSIFVFNGGLITNGDFESGINPWRLGVTNPLPAGLLTTENGNTYFSIPVTATGNPFDVNLSQVGISMIQGTTYRLTFDAWSDVNRSMIVGIGLSNDPWTNQSTNQDISTSVQNYSVDLVANFTNNNARVIFDLGAQVGRVNIDNVTLTALP